VSYKVVSNFRALTIASTLALLVSSQVMAESRPEVVERIKPVGMVTVEGGATPAAPAAAPSEPAQAAAPADPAAAVYVAKGCPACHGAEGKTPIMPSYPKVSSLSAKYIVNQLKDIKSGARDNGQSAAMKGIMAAVTEEDMVQIADYLSAIPRSGATAVKPVAEVVKPAAAPAPAAVPTAPADPGAALYTAKGCNACHGAEGKAPIMSVYPKVSSLSEAYIVNQLKDIKSGARANGQSAVMKGVMAAVSDDDMAKIAKYLSAIPR